MDKLYLLTIVAILLSFCITPLVRKIAVYVNAIDVPKDERRVHNRPIPLLGGLAVYITFIVVLILKKGRLQPSEIGIICGATIITIGGVIDDIYNIRPRYKMAFQIFAACALIFSGVQISIITNPFVATESFVNIGILSIPLTILWIVGITNAVNFLDGLDGLAAGVALISSVTILIIAMINGRGDAMALTAILSGAILGFLPYNFNPASIFMGDTGSQLLGFLLAAISIQGAIKSATALAVAVPILALGLPIYDTLFAMIRRKMNGKPIMQGDRGHLHHRLLDMGLTQKQAVLIMYLISAVLGAISILAMQISTTRSYFLLALVIITIVGVAWKYGFFENKE